MTIASSIGLKPFNITSNFFNNLTNFFLSSLVISFTFLFGLIPDNSTIIGINFCGNKFSRLFLKSLFLNSSKSLKILLSNSSSDKAGLKSMYNIILFSSNLRVISL